MNNNSINKKSKDELSLYLDNISKYEANLSKEEEATLSKLILAGDNEARNKLVNSNLRLVVSYAIEYSSYKVPLMDLIQAGNFGLIRAAEKFDYRVGVKFVTYATYWIKQSIENLIYQKYFLLKIPADIKLLLRRINAVKQDLLEESSKIPTYEEIQSALKDAYNIDIDISRIKEAELSSFKTLSLSEELSENSGDLEDIIPDPNNATPIDYADDAFRSEMLNELLSQLEERERILIILRYGLNGNSEHTLQGIGEIMGLSKERVRQLLKLTLHKLKNSEYRDTIEEYIRRK